MEVSLKSVAFLFLGFLVIATIHPNFFFCSGDSEVRCIDSERQALLKFKQHLEDPSNRLASWAGDEDCCLWVGVVCHNVTAHVHQLNLRSFPPIMNDFTTHENYDDRYEAYVSSMFGGKLNPSLLDLKYLNYLDLSNNNFSATQIPEFLGSMVSLRYLNLSNAKFVGLIPHQIGNLSNLHYLDLQGKNLYLMNLQWLSGLPLLQFLDMSRVNLSKASDWLQMTNTLSSLLELRLSNCQLHFIPSICSVNFSSLTTLHLSGNHFESTSIPLWPFSLHNLVSLDLSRNNFHGPIPIELTNMTSLTHLNLFYNSFFSIPNSIGNLTSLTNIDFSFNSFEGKLPSSFGKLCNLREIRLSGNYWFQEVSEMLESLPKCASYGLETVYVEQSQLFGHLPNEIEKFKNLVTLSFWNNLISGPIPMSLGNLSSLRILVLSKNQFKGTLPQNFGQLSNLMGLFIELNMLRGVVSEVHFSNLTKLNRFYAFGNQLTLEVSHNWIPPFQIKFLSLRSWNLGSKFPQWLWSQTHLRYLDISNTGVVDVVPPWFWNLSSHLNFLNLSHNQIYGQIPNCPMIFSTSSVIDMSSNHFKGPLPCISSNVLVLDLSKNSFFGSISHLLCFKMNESKQTELLNLERNHLSGKIPDCWMKWNSLVVINLGNNNFTGSIPASIGSLTLLKSLHLHNNKFSGNIPSSLKNCEKLMTFDVAENEFAGSIPSWIGHRCSSLMILNFRSNKFHGHIPEELCVLTSLQILDLSHNKLYGSIPRCVKNFSAMATKVNSNDDMNVNPSTYFYGESLPHESTLLVIKGRPLEYSTILHLVKSIDFSKNSLSGEIPKELTSLQGLQSLNLSYNQLIGSIPENIGVMVLLESIDFSLNQLSGHIPSSMSSLTFLNHLNLSNNNLAGKIPLGTQLQSFDASSFIGNKLCGPPLTYSCTINDVEPNNAPKGSKDIGGLRVDWFYVSMALGFVVGFWGVCGSLLLNKQWRIMYFQFLDQMGYKLNML